EYAVDSTEQRGVPLIGVEITATGDWPPVTRGRGGDECRDNADVRALAAHGCARGCEVPPAGRSAHGYAGGASRGGGRGCALTGRACERADGALSDAARPPRP